MARTAAGTVQRLVSSPVCGIRMRRRGGPLRHVPSSGAALRDSFGSHHLDTNRFAAGAQDFRAPLKQDIEVQVGSSVGPGRAVQLRRPLRAVNRSGASLTSRARIRPIRQLSLHALAVRSWDSAERQVRNGQAFTGTGGMQLCRGQMKRIFPPTGICASQSPWGRLLPFAVVHA